MADRLARAALLRGRGRAHEPADSRRGRRRCSWSASSRSSPTRGEAGVPASRRPPRHRTSPSRSWSGSRTVCAAPASGRERSLRRGMEVELVNDGPFTLVIDSGERAGHTNARVELTRASTGPRAKLDLLGGPATAAAGAHLRDAAVGDDRHGLQVREATGAARASGSFPTDCGFQPVIGFLPQMSQVRAMGREDLQSRKRPARGAGAIGIVARYDRPMQSSAARCR